MVLPLRGFPFTYLQRLHAHLGAGNPASSPVGPTPETVTPARDRREEEEVEDNSSVTEEKMTKVGKTWGEGFFLLSVRTGWWQLFPEFLGIFTPRFLGFHDPI